MKKLPILALTVSMISLISMTPAFAKGGHGNNGNRGMHGLGNRGLHLGQLKHGKFKGDNENDNQMSSSTLAFRAAVQKAQSDYLAAMQAARATFLAAIQAAKNQYLGSDSSTINLPPTVASPAAASPSTVTGTTTTLSVLGADTNGEASLTYSWTTISKPAGATDPSFSINNSNAAKNTVATFSRAGLYQLLATITDAGSLSVSSPVSVTVTPILSAVTVMPTTTTITVTSTQQFTATSTDQFGQPVLSTFSWSIPEISGGTVNSSGLYTPSATGTFHVVATSNVETSKRATSTVNVVSN